MQAIVLKQYPFKTKKGFLKIKYQILQKDILEYLIDSAKPLINLGH